MLLAAGPIHVNTTHGAKLALTLVPAASSNAEPIQRPDQLPHSRVARGRGDIAAAWLAASTNRYRHGVLGDELEASRLVVETTEGRRLVVDLPEERVFEDLEPRLADMDADGRDEILVVESHTAAGASLAVYGQAGGRLGKLSATAFLGLPNRWLNPLGVGDFDGDGQLDIALVATPHIGGRLRLYRYQPERLILFAERSGVSTHRIGSTELGLGHVVPGSPRDRLLVPDQSRETMMLLEWTPDGWHDIATVKLPEALASSLRPVAENRWQFLIENGQGCELRIIQ